ncbi:MAG: hypothetical protein ISF22_10115 [Methanomassiliicoccus sp.]|nr:hypothetical protein [Methanomassiliicoccus sp.]
MDEGAATLQKGIQELGDGSFQKFMSGTDRLIIAEFYMEGCEACAAMDPVYEELSREMSGDAAFVKVDARANIELALHYGVVATPTFLLFCRNQFLVDIVGVTNTTVLRNTIKDLIRHHQGCAAGKMTPFEQDGYG